MANNKINVRILQKYDSEANWAANNPILYYGEVAYSSDKNNQYKVGNGTSKWSQLAYNSVNKSATADSASNANALFLNPSNRQKSANLDLTSTSLNRRVTYMLSTSTMTEGMPPSTGHILTFGWDTTAGLGAQLAIGTGRNGHMYIRGASDVTANGVSSSVWAENWFTLLDSNNYSAYAAPKSHASSATTYGIGTASNYGHVKLSDIYTSAIGAASTGIVPSQSALYNAYNALNTKFNGYLPLAGGTINLSTFYGLVLKRSDTNGVGISYENSKSILGGAGFLHDGSFIVSSGVSSGTNISGDIIKATTSAVSFSGNVTAPKFNGSFVGNLSGTATNATNAVLASTANKWTTARTLKLTGSTEGSISFDGSGNATMATTEGTVSFKKMGIVNQTTDWNTLTTPGCYKVQMSSWGDADTYHSPNTYGGIYSYGLLLVFKSSIEEENRTIQIYFPHSIANSVHGTVVKRMLNKTTWNSWGPLFTGISKSYIGLGNVDNTSDSSKNVLSATKWTTVRTMTIGSTGKSVNGTANVAWTLDEIGAAPKAGSTSLGRLASTITLGNGGSGTILQNSGTAHQKLEFLDNSSAGDAVFRFSQSSDSGSTWSNLFEIRDNRQVVAATFVGTLSGNANTASKWISARTLSLTGSVTGSVSIDGSSNMTLATTTNHTHSYLPLSGGVLSGLLTANKGISIPTIGGYWITGMTQAQLITFTGNSSGSYHPMIKYVMNSGNVANIGAFGNTFGFFGYKSGRTENDYDCCAYLDIANNRFFATAFYGPLTGNASTATALQTSRTINGTSFNGTANITTASWGAARTLTIGNTGKSVNGSGNITWSLSEIGAAATSHTHSYLPLTGGTVSNTIHSSKFTSTYLAGNQGEAIINSTVAAGLYVMLAKMNSANGYFTHGTFKDKYLLQYTVKSTVDAGTNNVTKSAILLDESGNTWFPGTVNSSDFITTSANCFRNKCGNYGFIIRNDGANTYFLLTNSGDQSGSYNNLRPFYFSNSSGLVTMNNGLISAGVSKFTNSTESTSASSGAIVISGGLGVAKQIVSNGALFVGHGVPANASIYLNGKLALKGNDTWLRINESQAFTAGTHFGTGILRTDGTFQVGSGGSSINITTSSIQLKQPTTISNTTSITNTTASTSKSTGALKVSGGIGAAGQVNAQSFKVNEKWTLQVDSATGSLNFVMV